MVRSVLVFAYLPLLAQQTSVVNYDGLGNPVSGPTTSTTRSDGLVRQVQSLVSLNGRRVPIESTEERVLRDDPNGKVIEKLLRHYDASGNLGAIEKVLVEEQKRADGSTATRTTTYRSDVNGNLALAERSFSETRVSGGVKTTNETFDRPSVNGTLQTAERRSIVARESADGESKQVAVFRPNENGGFYEAQRQVSETRSTAEGSVLNQTTYESSPLGVSRLLNQRISRSRKGADGSESTVVDVYTANTPGVATAGSEVRPQLREQQLIERRPTKNGSSESVEVRRPSISDPTRLGPPTRISETVCTGKCP
jgi:hypothetical protein